MSRRRAISALLTPARCSFRIWAACFPTITGLPRCFPLSRASARPARIRSRTISCSKGANTDRRPAMARPVGVVRSSASVSDTKATPGSARSFRVTTRSTSERPHRSSRQPVRHRCRDGVQQRAVSRAFRVQPRRIYSRIVCAGQEENGWVLRSLPDMVVGRTSIESTKVIGLFHGAELRNIESAVGRRSSVVVVDQPLGGRSKIIKTFCFFRQHSGLMPSLPEFGPATKIRVNVNNLAIQHEPQPQAVKGVHVDAVSAIAVQNRRIVAIQFRAFPLDDVQRALWFNLSTWQTRGS
jgi:hypothetical protein